MDIAEELAIERITQLFGCDFANVQPNSGSQANQAVMMALSKPGATLLGMSLDAGGHLTHGARPNMSGKWFNAVQYGVDIETGLIDYDQVAALAREHKPEIIVAGGSAYSRTIDFARFRKIADEVGAWFWVDMAHIAGWCWWRSPEPLSACTCRDINHTQDLARTARRASADK